MDQGWKQLPLFVIVLLLSNSYGFKGGASNAHHRWGQPSDYAFSPHAVQSSEVPVTVLLPEEMGHLKRLNLLQFVRGSVSSRHDSTDESGSSSSYPTVALSSAQGAVSQSATVQGSQKQFTSSYGTQEGSSTPFNLQGSTTYGGSHQPQGTTNQFVSGSPSSYPSVALSSPQGDARQSTTVQRPWKQFTFTGSSDTQEGSSTPINLPGSTTYGGSIQPLGTTNQFVSGSPSSYPSVALSSPQGTALKSAEDLGPWKQFTSTFTGSSGTQEGSSTPLNLQGSTTYGGSLQPLGTTNQFVSGSPSSYPSVALSSSQGAVLKSATVQRPWKQFTYTVPGSSGTQEGSSTPLNLQGSTIYGGSLQPLGTTNQFVSGSPSSYPSVALSSSQGAVLKSATVQRPWKQFTFTCSSDTQEGSSTPINLPGSTTYGGSLQPLGTTNQFVSGSPSSYPSVTLSSSQGAVLKSATVQRPWKQFTYNVPGSSGTQEGSSTPLNLQGSTTYGGSLQPLGTTNEFVSGSPSSYPSVALSSPQGATLKSAEDLSPWKQFTSTFTGSSGTQEGSSTPFNLQGSTTYGGSHQPQGNTNHFVSGSPSSYPSVALSSPQGVARQSTTVQRPWKQFTFTGSSDTQEGSSTPINLPGSTTYGGSLQPLGTTNQFVSGSPSSYPSVALSSSQDAVSQSAKVQRPWRQFTSTFTGSSGNQEGSSTPFNLQGSTYGGSLKPLGTTNQFVSGSPSSYPSVALSSSQDAVSQSAKGHRPWRQFTSTFTGSFGNQEGSSTPLNLQGSTTYGGSLQPLGTTNQFVSGSPSSYPSVALSSPQGVARQSTTVQRPWKQFTYTVPVSSGTQEGSSTPFNLQGSTYGGSLKPLGTTNQFVSGSPSSYPSVALSSPQGATLKSAEDLSPWRKFTSTFTGSSGTQEGSSTPLNLQGSTTYGGSLQPLGTTNQFVSGSPSSYPSVALSSSQGAVLMSATVQRPWKQFTYTVPGSSGTQEGSSTPFNLQGSTTYGGSHQPQGTASKFVSGSPSSYPSVGLSSPQGVARQSSQALQSYFVPQSQKSQRLQLSQGIQASGAAASQFRSLSSGDTGVFVSAKRGSTSFGGFPLNYRSPTSKYTPGSYAYAKLGSSPLAVSSQSTSDQRSNGLYISDSWRTQGLLGAIEIPSRLPSHTPDSTSSNQISEHFLTGSNLAQASVGLFSGIPQSAQALRESGSDASYTTNHSSSRSSAKGL